MSGGKYFYIVFLTTLTLLGLAAIGVFTADLATAAINDTTPVFPAVGIWAVALGVGSLITSIISAVRSD